MSYVGVHPDYRRGMQEFTDSYLGESVEGRNARHILRLMTREYLDAWLIHTVESDDDIRVMHFNGDIVRVQSNNPFGLVTVSFTDGYTGEVDKIDFPKGFTAQVIADMTNAGFGSFARLSENGRG